MAGHTRPSISEAALVEEDEDEEEEGTPGRGSDAAGAPGFSGGVCGKCGVVVSVVLQCVHDIDVNPRGALGSPPTIQMRLSLLCLPYAEVHLPY